MNVSLCKHTSTFTAVKEVVKVFPKFLSSHCEISVDPRPGRDMSGQKQMSIFYYWVTSTLINASHRVVMSLYLSAIMPR